MLDNTEDILEKFAKRVIQQSRTRLTKGKMNVNKSLYNSLKYKIDTTPSSFIIHFLMNEYGSYVDRGVKGTKSNYVENKKTPFSYKPSSNLIGLEAATGTFGKWAKKKGFRLRDPKGKYAKGTYKSIGFIIAQSIKKKGIRATHFFTRSFEQAYEKLPKEIIEAYKLDLEEFISSSTYQTK